jgi:hypothetical protein
MSQLPTTPLAVRWDKMQRWLFFVALIAVMPTLFSWIVGSVTYRGVTWQSLFGGGELIVGALALSADAAGGLTRGPLQGRRLLVFCLCIFMAIATAGLVSLTATKVLTEENARLADLSVYAFLIAFIVSAVGKWITED